MQTQPIVGVWQTAIKIDSMSQGFEGLYTFFADGNFLEINSFKETNSGVWQYNGDHYPVTFWCYLFDDSSQVTGKVKVRLALQMVDANHYTGHGVAKAYDLAGQPMVSPFDGLVTVNGTRLEVELL